MGGWKVLPRLQCIIFNVHGCLIGFALKNKGENVSGAPH